MSSLLERGNSTDSNKQIKNGHIFALKIFLFVYLDTPIVALLLLCSNTEVILASY